MSESRKRIAQIRLDLQAFGRRVRELRGFDMTQAALAKKIGITQGYLSALENGEKEPGATVLLAIAQQFGRTVDWLLTGRITKR